ncbi:MAG: OmpA family protein, partial [Candidatus Latescibacteria bacterium]|nr:OmpA family protein [Candidatus Latescibacterota bacterium]
GAELKTEIRNLMMSLGELLRQLPNQVVVKGHTDNVPIANPTSEFPTNWELSYQRAVNVVRFLITETLVLPMRMAAEGYGEYRPIATNTTPEGRAKNRRVEIHILYAGEEDGNLEILAEVFKNANMDASRKDGAPIIKPTKNRRRRRP